MASAACPVCWEGRAPLVTTLCGHSFCMPCLLRWHWKKQTCPICRACTVLRCDGGDKAGGRCATTSAAADADADDGATTTVVLGMPDAGKAGLSLRSVPSLPHALQVIGVATGSAADSHGLRHGDVIYTINSLPCVTLQWALDAFDAAQSMRSLLRLQLVREAEILCGCLPRTSPLGTLWDKWRRCARRLARVL